MSEPPPPAPVEWWPPPYPPPQPPRRGLSTGAVIAIVVASLAVLVPVAVVGLFAFGQVVDLSGPAGVPAAEAGCQEDVRVPAGEGDTWHVPVGQKVEYAVTPPAFGRHWPNYLQGVELRTLYTVADRPPVERLVHSLEHGYTILWYDDTVARSDLTELAEEAGPKFIAAPWTPLDGPGMGDGVHVVLTHWVVLPATEVTAEPASLVAEGTEDPAGVWRRCARLSGEVVADYMTAYPYTDSREPNAP